MMIYRHKIVLTLILLMLTAAFPVGCASSATTVPTTAAPTATSTTAASLMKLVSNKHYQEIINEGKNIPKQTLEMKSDTLTKDNMDTTQEIILTTIFNLIISGLIGGIVIYTLQKKIDATIQNSIFEYQTKFARNHQKRIETLEALYNEYLIYETHILETVFDRSEPPELTLDKYRKLIVKNRIYLSDHEYSEVDDIYWKCYYLSALHNIVIRSKEMVPDEHLMKWLIETTKVDFTPIDYRNPDAALFSNEFVALYKNQEERLLMLYKSASEIKSI